MIDADRAREAKRLAALTAVAEIEDGMVVGLGTGTTAAFAIAALGERIAGGLRVTAAATSAWTEAAAREAGITIVDFAGLDRVDLGIDGADEIDARFRAIKGGGGALLREKIVAAAADRMICIVDASKRVDRLGAFPLPIEVLPFARAAVMAAVSRLGGRPRLRTRNDVVVLSDQGNLLIDCAFDAIGDPEALAAALDAVPGVLGHGLFLTEIDALIVGAEAVLERPERV